MPPEALFADVGTYSVPVKQVDLARIFPPYRGSRVAAI